MTGQDKVGFGKFAHLTYAELAQQHMDYIQWCKDTVSECGLDTSGSMRRLVKWATSSSSAAAASGEASAGRASASHASESRRPPSLNLKGKRRTEETYGDMQATQP
eukprot:3236945-Alexandrium_andersonii.AAC.1